MTVQAKRYMAPLQETEIWANKVIDLWKSRDISLCGGASSNLIAKTEHFLSIQFPESFKRLYQKANGFKHAEWTSNMFCIWSLDNILFEHKFKPRSVFIAFCDFFIHSHWIGFVKGQSGIFKYYDLEGSTPERITDTFEEAIDLINEDAAIIY